MKIALNEAELQERIERSFRRLADSAYYQIGEIFSPADYDWPGDKEGHTLLAFMSHYKINGRVIPCMEQMLKALPEKVNEAGYFGPVMHELLHEQQLSGHNWLLRGLCEHYEVFGDELSLTTLRKIVANLYMNTKGRYVTYPVERGGEDGGVSGESMGEYKGWLLSSDTGCGFMSIDGLSHAYAVLKDPAVKELIDEMVKVFLSMDKVGMKLHTHGTLTVARGMMRMYNLTGDAYYLDGAKSIYEIYVHGGGMTYTYQNVNWWRRYNTWTEPCGIVDSMMLAGELYKATGNAEYRTIAARIWHNGFATAQRSNGGAGTDTVVTRAEGGQSVLRADLYEAYFCCTMRLAEGLWYAHANQEYLYAETEGKVTKQENGTYADGDILYVLVEGDGKDYVTDTVMVDGMALSPILKYYNLPDEIMNRTVQKVIF
jgi:hypothetical protein